MVAIFSGCKMLNKEDPNKPTTLVEVEDYESLNKGTVSVMNGVREFDTIPFHCAGCDNNLPENFKPKIFDLIVNESTDRARNLLNNPRSFKPISMSIKFGKAEGVVHYETDEEFTDLYLVSVDYLLVGANAFGIESELEETIQFYIYKGMVDDEIENIKKLESLVLDESDINRGFSLYDEDNYLAVHPVITGTGSLNLIVGCSFNCIDKGAALTFYLDNDHIVILRSWNDFNCDPIAYYEVSERHLQQLKDGRLENITLFSDNNYLRLSPAKNNADYFQQLANLFLD